MRNDIVLLNKDNLYERRVKNGYGIKSANIYGKKDIQAEMKTADYVKNSKGQIAESIVTASGEKWHNSAAEAELWNKLSDIRTKIIKSGKKLSNVNQFPDDYYDLIEKIRIDITRRRIEEMDFTPEFTIDLTNPNYSKSIDYSEYYDYEGVFEEIKGTGDNVPMLQQKTGQKRSVDVILYGLGHKRSLEDEIYNLDIYSLQKVNRAVTSAHTALRNNLCFNPLIALTNGTWGAGVGWHASQQVAADTTGATYDVRLYLTMRNAIRTLLGLLDTQTLQEIDAPRITLLCRNRVIEWDLQRVINGQLEKFGTPVENRSRLAIDEIWTYKGRRIAVGEKPTTYLGVPDGTAYMFITGPDGAPIWTLNKRQLTQEIGRGSVLQASREERLWYFGQAEDKMEFLGSSYDNGATFGSGYGYVVEIELPAEPGTT